MWLLVVILKYMNTEERTYTAIRMANGKMTHLRTTTASVTYCGRWTGNTRQYQSDDKIVTCKACGRYLNEQEMAQGFTIGSADNG